MKPSRMTDCKEGSIGSPASRVTARVGDALLRTDRGGACGEGGGGKGKKGKGEEREEEGGEEDIEREGDRKCRGKKDIGRYTYRGEKGEGGRGSYGERRRGRQRGREKKRRRRARNISRRDLFSAFIGRKFKL